MARTTRANRGTTSGWTKLPVGGLPGFPNVLTMIRDVLREITDQVDYIRANYGGIPEITPPGNIIGRNGVSVTSTENGQVLVQGNYQAGAGISVNNGTIANTGVRSLEAQSPLQASASTGAVSVSIPDQAANTFMASPDGAAGAVSFRTITEDDIPQLPASKSSVTNDGYSTVQEVLDDLLYTAIDITSLTGGSTNEKGSTVNAVNLAWAINKTPTAQSFNQGIGAVPVADRAKALAGLALTADTTYTLTVTDERGATDTVSTSVVFRQKRYWGVSANAGPLTSAQVLALGNSEFSTSKAQSRTFDCTGGAYFYLAWPASLGTGVFTVGGLGFSDMHLDTVSVTNASGYTENYYVYRPNNIQTGAAIQVTVS